MITVIGAGPAGCYAAYLLAKAGQDVQIFDEKKEIGKPIKCTALLTSKLNEVIDFPVKSAIINKIVKVELNSENKKVILKLKDPDIVFDREKLDKLIAKKASEKGVKIHLNHKFLGLEKKNGRMILKIKEKGRIKNIETDILIGADGPLSKVIEFIDYNEIKRRRKEMGYAMQVRMKMHSPIDKSMMAIWFDNNTRFFSWVVPENKNIARIGMGGTKEEVENMKKLLERFNGKIIEYQGGMVPLYSKIKVEKDNIYVIGDAALQIKASTKGGIIPGLIAAKCLKDAIIKKGSYEKNLKELNKELNLHLKIRKILNRFKKEDYDELLGLIEKPELKKLLETTPRDALRKKFVKMVFAQKKLLFFARKLFRIF